MKTARQKILIRLVGVAILLATFLIFRSLIDSFGHRMRAEADRHPVQLPIVRITARDWQGTPEQVEEFQKEVDAHNAEFERGQARQAATAHRAMVGACLIVGLLLSGWVFFELSAKMRSAKPPRRY